MASDIVIYLDGASRGNPGPAASGVVIRPSKGPMVRLGYFLGRATNNVAEYTALVKALEWVHKHKPEGKLVMYSDSQLLVRQVMGEYRVKEPTLKELWKVVRTALEKVPAWEFHHVPREENTEADRMANLALDEEGDVRE